MIILLRNPLPSVLNISLLWNTILWMTKYSFFVCWRTGDYSPNNTKRDSFQVFLQKLLHSSSSNPTEYLVGLTISRHTFVVFSRQEIITFKLLNFDCASSVNGKTIFYQWIITGFWILLYKVYLMKLQTNRSRVVHEFLWNIGISLSVRY